jgi:hypothetical protein
MQSLPEGPILTKLNLLGSFITKETGQTTLQKARRSLKINANGIPIK